MFLYCERKNIEGYAPLIGKIEFVTSHSTCLQLVYIPYVDVNALSYLRRKKKDSFRQISTFAIGVNPIKYNHVFFIIAHGLLVRLIEILIFRSLGQRSRSQ